MTISNALHALVARKKRKDFHKRLNCSMVNVGYCSSNDQVKSSVLLGQRRRRPVCRNLKVIQLTVIQLNKI